MPRSRSRRKPSNKRKNKLSNEPKPYEVIKHELRPYVSPLAHLSVEERGEVSRGIGRAAKKEFEEIYPQLPAWFEEFDAIYLLSFVTIYFLVERAGIDREASEGKLDFYPHYLEVLQAIALTRPRSGSAKSLNPRATELSALMSTVMSSFHQRAYDVPEGISEGEDKKRFVLFMIQSQTAAIRNPAYADHSKRYTKKIFSRLAGVFESGFGLDPEKLIDTLSLLNERFETNLRMHLAALRVVWNGKDWRDVWKRHVAAFLSWSIEERGPDISEEQGRKIWEQAKHDLEQMKAMLHLHTDLFLPDIFTFDVEEFAELYGDASKSLELRRVLDLWSFGFGDLEAEDKERFILTNPVLRKPIVKVNEGEYFFPMTTILGHITPLMMEVLVQEAGSASIEKLNKARAKVLEDQAFQLFKASFPHAQIYSGSKWKNPQDAQHGENDLLIVIDKFAIVVECKSGTVNPSARRGGELKVIETLRKLVIDPAEQAMSFIRLLSENPGVHTFATENGPPNVVDNRSVAHYIPLGLTQEDLGAVSGNLQMCIDAGLIPTTAKTGVPSISIHDVEVILTILENEVEVLHYLTRRAEIERTVRYLGEEGDLLAYYLDTAFNLGTAEGSSDVSFNLLLKNKELDPYFVAHERGINVEKPRLHLTKWWRDLINEVIDRKVSHWTEAGFMLLNIPFEYQRILERQFKTLRSRVKLGLTREKYEWAMFKTEPDERSYIFAAFPYVRRDPVVRNDMMRHILGSVEDVKGLQGMLCIGSYAPDPGYPYDVLLYTGGKLGRDEAESVS